MFQDMKTSAKTIDSFKEYIAAQRTVRFLSLGKKTKIPKTFHETFVALDFLFFRKVSLNLSK
jgi:hypothetical protein